MIILKLERHDMKQLTVKGVDASSFLPIAPDGAALRLNRPSRGTWVWIKDGEVVSLDTY